MEAVIKIVDHHERPMKFLNGKHGEDAKNLQIGIIERGTVGSQTVVAFALETKGGQNIIAEITERQFILLCEVFNSAQVKFSRNVGKN